MSLDPVIPIQVLKLVKAKARVIRLREESHRVTTFPIFVFSSGPRDREDHRENASLGQNKKAAILR